MGDAGASSIKKDIASAYTASGARVASWVVVSAMVFRHLGKEGLGLLTLTRATVGILTYSTLGLGPALVKQLTAAAGARAQSGEIPVANRAVAGDSVRPTLAYAERPQEPELTEEVAAVYATGEWLAVWLGAAALVLAGIYSCWFSELHNVSYEWSNSARTLALCMGAGMVCRMISEAPSGLLQARGRIALDNLLTAGAEIAWAIWTAAMLWNDHSNLVAVGMTFLGVNVLLLLTRGVFGRAEVRSLTTHRAKYDRTIARGLLAMGVMIALAQVADFLYAPTDCILINRYLGEGFVAYYSPAIQIDAGLLLLVNGLAAVLYPRSAAAHARGDARQLKRYYRRGTAFSFAVLTVAGLVVWGLSKWIFLMWFRNAMEPTRAILPLLLIHTVIGGTSAVGRSVLLGMGKMKALMIAALVSGVGNVIASFLLVKYTNLGLVGIVIGTIVAVTARCAIWMPWYVSKSLREAHGQIPLEETAPVTPAV